MISEDNSSIADAFAEVRRVLIAAVEQAERELQETSHAQLRGAAQVRRLFAETSVCAMELEAHIAELVTHLDQARTSISEIRERLTAGMRRLDEQPPAAEPEPAPEPVPAQRRRGKVAEPEETPAPAAAPVSGEDTVRVLRAALEVLSRQRNGDTNVPS